MLDFVQPAGTRRWDLGGRGQTRLDNAQTWAGTLTQRHTVLGRNYRLKSRVRQPKNKPQRLASGPVSLGTPGEENPWGPSLEQFSMNIARQAAAVRRVAWDAPPGNISGGTCPHGRASVRRKLCTLFRDRLSARVGQQLGTMSALAPKADFGECPRMSALCQKQKWRFASSDIARRGRNAL